MGRCIGKWYGWVGIDKKARQIALDGLILDIRQLHPSRHYLLEHSEPAL